MRTFLWYEAIELLIPDLVYPYFAPRYATSHCPKPQIKSAIVSRNQLVAPRPRLLPVAAAIIPSIIAASPGNLPPVPSAPPFPDRNQKAGTLHFLESVTSVTPPLNAERCSLWGRFYHRAASHDATDIRGVMHVELALVGPGMLDMFADIAGGSLAKP